MRHIVKIKMKALLTNTFQCTPKYNPTMIIRNWMWNWLCIDFAMCYLNFEIKMHTGMAWNVASPTITFAHISVHITILGFHGLDEDIDHV